MSGSLTHTSVRARINSWYTKAKDSAIGSSFDQHVVGGYRFLMRFYNPGDEIYMFGFSRGAYIARFLAEMLDYIGLLSHGNEEMVKFAWKAFSQWQCRQQSSGSKEEVAAAEAEKERMFNFMKGFRETFSRPVGRIKFLGLFDTVNSVPRFETAWMQRSKHPYTARSSAKVIRHAVSIDERRAKFRQDLMYQGNPRHRSRHRHTHLGEWMNPENWNMHGHHLWDQLKGEKAAEEKQQEEKQDGAGKPMDRGRPRNKLLSPEAAAGMGEPQKPGSQAGQKGFAPYRLRSKSRRRRPSMQRPVQDDCRSEISSGLAMSELPWDDEEDDAPQDIDEVWFSGGHADVGGGWEMLEGSKSASHVPLAWIVREAMRAGLPFDVDKVAEMGCACAAEWDPANPSKRRADVKKMERSRRRAARASAAQTANDAAANIPDIRMDNGAEPAIPEPPSSTSQTPSGGHPDTGPTHAKNNAAEDDDDSDSDDEHEGMFQHLMSRAHTARIHDSLAFGGGLGPAAVAAWKMMEWLPFRRMDLKSDGTWEPIRWPLPRGEVRDVPDNVRVHGSVLRRMEADPDYRPGNLIVGGGGRGLRKAPPERGTGQWKCVADKGDPIGEIWERKSEELERLKREGTTNGHKA